VKDQVVDDDDDDNDARPSLCQDPRFEQYMPVSRWKDLWRFFPEIFADETKKETDLGISFLWQLTNLIVQVKVNL
jgi:hypothetical protein